MAELTEAAKQAKANLDARVAELTALTGKWFVRKDGKGHPIKVEGYAGIGVRDGVSMHLIQVETVDARWTPPATAFLAAHDEIPAPVVEAKIEGVI